MEVKNDQPFERVDKHLPYKLILFNNFIGGLAWALGATIGLSIIVTVLTLIVKNVDFNLIPVVGNFASEVINFVMTHNPNLQK